MHCCRWFTWSVSEKLSLPAERRTTDRGIVTLAVATHRTMSVAEGGLLPCMGVPAGAPSFNIASHQLRHPGAMCMHLHEQTLQAFNGTAKHQTWSVFTKNKVGPLQSSFSFLKSCDSADWVFVAADHDGGCVCKTLLLRPFSWQRQHGM